MKSKTKIIVITGAESTGKSTLTKNLAEHYNVPFIPEIARDYVEHLNHKYSYSDVENIAKLQIEQLNLVIQNSAPIIFVDTWLIVTKIWFEFVFDKTPEWFIKEFNKTKIDLFLVCDIDIPWVKDPVRENGGENRIILQNKYIENIKLHRFKYKIVNGIKHARLLKAIQFVDELK